MEAVLENVKRTMSYINDDAKDLDKDEIIKRLQSELEKTLTIHFVTVNQLIIGNGKEYEYRQLREQLQSSLAGREIGDATDTKSRIEGIRELSNDGGLLTTGHDEWIAEDVGNEQSSGLEEEQPTNWGWTVWWWSTVARPNGNLSPFADVRRNRWSSRPFVSKTAGPLSDVAVQTDPPAVRNAAATQTDHSSGQRNVVGETDSVARSTVATHINHADKLTYDTYSQTDRTANETVAVHANYLVDDNAGVRIDCPRTAAGGWSTVRNVVEVPKNLSGYRRTVTVRFDSGEVTEHRTRGIAVQTDPVVCCTHRANVKTAQTEPTANNSSSGTISGYT